MSYRPFGQWRPKEQRAAQQIADLTARNAALVAALRAVKPVIDGDIDATPSHCTEVRTALAAEERATKAAKEG